MTQLDEYQPVKFVTYGGENDLSEIKVSGDKVIGIRNGNDKQMLEKPDILFACPTAAWPEIDSYIEILSFVRKEVSRPIQNQSERFNIQDWLLRSAQEAQVPVVPVTRYGHILKGTIEDFDEEAIYMQIREHIVILYRHGIYEFAIEEWHQGEVTEFNESRGFGFIESGNLSRIFVHISEVIDTNITSLQMGQKVEFDINRRIKGLSAINVNLSE